MINDLGHRDLLAYRRIVLLTALFVLALLGASIFACWQMHITWLMLPLWGAFCGSLLASANVLGLAYAFYAIAIKKGPKRVILWPLVSFVLMCASALFFVLYQEQCLLGFALGLTTPLIFAAIIAYQA